MKILKFIRFVLCAAGILILLLCIFLFFTTRGPYRNIKVDITLPSDGNWKDSSPLQVGVGVKEITPDLSQYDTWTDIDNDGSFNPELDSYEDRNNNGEFDFVWLAGFGNSRPAQGVNDPLWSRAIAFRNNGITVVLVSIDSVGITHERYIGIRNRLSKLNVDIDLVSFACTHTHNALIQ